jgi:hypothetical protein
MHFEIDMIPSEDQLREEARKRMEMLNMSRSENLSIPDWSESGIIFVSNELGVLTRWG